MKVLIADDHPLVRDALARTIQQLDAQVSVQLAGDFDGALRSLEAELPDLALIDLRMPGMMGLRGVEQLLTRFPSLRLVVASGEDDPAVIRQILGLGACGFLPKREGAEVMLQALRLVLSGGIYMPAQALDDYRNGQPPAPKPDASGLTPRQLDVLQLLMRGEPNKLIARELGLTEGTVKIHIAAILRALQARNRTEAVVVARQLGLGASA